MPLIVGLDGADGLRRLINSRKGEQAGTGWQNRAEASVLSDHWASTGKVGGAAIAEPAAPQADVLVLGHCELSTRIRDETLIRVEVHRKIQRVTHVPAAALQQLPVVAVEAAQRKHELRTGTRRQFQKLLELQVLAPVVDLTV